MFVDLPVPLLPIEELYEMLLLHLRRADWQVFAGMLDCSLTR